MNWTVRVYLEVTDALNTTVRFNEPPKRIISLAPSNTEMLFAAGMGSGIVAVDDYSDYPPELANMSLPTVGGPYSGISTEAIVNLTPDLVVATEINPVTAIDQLKSLNITVLSVESKTIDEILDNILLLGRIGNTQDTAKELVSNPTTRIDTVKDFSDGLGSERKPKLFYVVWYPELWTPGKDTYANDLMNIAGGINTAKDGSGWFMMNKEALITKDPDVIICSGMGGYRATVCNQIRNDTALSTLSAVKKDRMYVVPDSNIVERAGPRIVDGLEFFYDIVKDNLKPVKTSSGGGGAPTHTPEHKTTIFRKKIQDYEEVKETVLEEIGQKIIYDVHNKAVEVPLLLLNRFPWMDGVEGIPQSFEEDIYEYAAEVAVFKYFGGENAVGKAVEDKLSEGQEVARLWGDTRVGTSLDIAKEVNPEEVIITGYSPDMEAAVTSYLYDAPIIYVNEEKLDIVTDFLKSYQPKILFINVDESIKKRIEDGI